MAGIAGDKLSRLPGNSRDSGVLDVVCGQLQSGGAFLLRHWCLQSRRQCFPHLQLQQLVRSWMSFSYKGNSWHELRVAMSQRAVSTVLPYKLSALFCTSYNVRFLNSFSNSFMHLSAPRGCACTDKHVCPLIGCTFHEPVLSESPSPDPPATVHGFTGSQLLRTLHQQGSINAPLLSN